MNFRIPRSAVLPAAGLVLAACAADSPMATAPQVAGPAFSVSNNVGLSSVTNTATGFGTGDRAVIGYLSRANVIQITDASNNNLQWCRSNGPGQDPGAGSIRAIYQDGNGKPAALAYIGQVLWVYSRVNTNFVCGMTQAMVGSSNLGIGTVTLPATVPGGAGDASVVIVQSGSRVQFRRGSTTGLIIGRTNGEGDDGTLIAGWKGSDGKPYALIGRGDANKGEYRVITPSYVNSGIMTVNTVGRVVH